MSLAEQSQQWYPSMVQVTVLQARGLGIKGKNGTNDAYAVMQVAKEKFSTSVVEKCVSPMWKEEATFDLPLFHHGNEERCTLHVHVMHRSLMGPDKLLGQAVINLLELNEVKSRNKTEWFNLLNKAGKLDKDRGEVLLDIQFVRNNMTASMFDLSATNKSRSRLGKLKDKVQGKKKEGLSDSASAVVPSFSQVLTDSEEEAAGGNEGGTDKGEKKKKKHKLKSLFTPKSNLQRNMSQSMSVLGPLPERNTPLSGSRSSGLNVDSSEGKRKFKFLTHKRTGSSDSKGHPGSSSLPGHSKTGSLPAAEQSNLCINGSHVYKQEPQPRSARAGSTFSVASSGLGSMEDLHGPQGRKSSNTSIDSLRAIRQPSTWAEEETSNTAHVEEREDLVRDLPNHAQTKTSNQDPPGREDPPLNVMIVDVELEAQSAPRERKSAESPQAPDHLGARSGPQSQSQGDQNVYKYEGQAKDSQLKSSSIPSQRPVQKTTPMNAFPTAPTAKDVPPSQSSTYHGQQPGGLRVAKHSKGLAPSRPHSSFNERKTIGQGTKDDPPSELKVFVAKEKTDAIQKDSNSECKQSSLTASLAGEITESLPPCKSKTSTASNESNVHWDSQSNQICPSQKGSEYDNCQIQLKSLKKVRAPLPPPRSVVLFCDQSSANQNTDTSLKGQNRGEEVAFAKKGIPKPCVASPASPSSQPNLLETSGSRQQRLQKLEAVGSGHGLNPLLLASGGGSLEPVTAWGSGEEAGEKGEKCAATSRRPHPVKPLSALEHQPAFNVPGTQCAKSFLHDRIQENIKAKESSATGPYSQLSKDELISLVVKQHEQLSVKNKKIAELERYIDNLLVRVIEESPHILMSLNSIKIVP
ncbi:rab11 family-interacting protein 1 [Aplochiton taeniatus]